MRFTEEELTNIVNYSAEEVTTHKAEVASFYAYLFKDRDVCVSCMSKIKQYHNKLKEHGLNLLKQITMSKESNFRLREEIGSLQMDFGSSEYFNNSNITDEIALKYLRINPNRIANFESYPANWRELIEETDTETKQKQTQKQNNKLNPKSRN